ncbi:MAG: SAM-dependent methyltransferase [Phenylobacterium sp.]|nr:SAM-dependent methyltransferase [Phenylobacterium sp.]
MATKTYQTRHGPMLAFTGDQYMTPTLEQRGEYSPDEWAMLEQLATPGAPVVEIGANIGVHTIPLARRCAPALLYAFEPQQRVFQVLCANLALNGIDNVLAYPEACGETQGEAVIPPVDYDATFNFGGVSLQPAQAPGQKVRVVTLDSLGLAACGLLKIDVEGFEPQVLRGAAETIARCRPVIYTENDRPQQQAEVIALLTAMGYRLYWHTPAIADRAVFNGVLFLSINLVALPVERSTAVHGPDPIDPDNWTCPVNLGPPPGG